MTPDFKPGDQVLVNGFDSDGIVRVNARAVIVRRAAYRNERDFFRVRFPDADDGEDDCTVHACQLKPVPKPCEVWLCPAPPMSGGVWHFCGADTPGAILFREVVGDDWKKEGP